MSGFTESNTVEKMILDAILKCSSAGGQTDSVFKTESV